MNTQLNSAARQPSDKCHFDRRLYRRKYDAANTLAAFSATERDEVELEKLTGELLNVVREAMQLAHANLWLKNPGQKANQ